MEHQHLSQLSFLQTTRVIIPHCENNVKPFEIKFQNISPILCISLCFSLFLFISLMPSRVYASAVRAHHMHQKSRCRAASYVLFAVCDRPLVLPVQNAHIVYTVKTFHNVINTALSICQWHRCRYLPYNTADFCMLAQLFKKCGF